MSRGLISAMAYLYDNDRDPTLYESPIEEIFAWTLDKHVDARTKVTPQYDVHTRAGTFRLDFLLERPGLKVGIECDGKDFHDPHRDEWRDANILAVKAVDRMYRFSGKDLYLHVDHCLGVIMKHEAAIFSERGRLNLETLLSDDLPDIDTTLHDLKKLGPVRVTRYTYLDPFTAEALPWRPFWTVYARFALENPSMPLEQMMAAFNAAQEARNPAF